MTDAPHDAPKTPWRAWRTKWRWVAAFWVVQALILYSVWVLLIVREDPLSSPGLILDLLSRSEMVWGGIVLTGTITLMQAVLLLPVRQPEITRSSLGVRIVHCGLCAATVAAILWLLIWPVMITLEHFHVGNWVGVESTLSYSCPIAGAVVAFAFLWPRTDSGVPLRLSVTIAALGAALLLSALLGTIASVVDYAAGRYSSLTGYVMIGGGLVGWIVVTPLLLRFCRKGRPETMLARLAARLFLGTIVEAAAIIPLDVMVRKKESCYCPFGTFWGLTFCWGIGAMVLGPAVFLLPLSSRRKRWYGGRCDVCDYDMSGCMDAERCPECGTGWKEAAKSV